MVLNSDLEVYLSRFFVGPDKEGDNKIDSTFRGKLVLTTCDSGRYMLERMKSIFDKYISKEQIIYMMQPTTRFADGEIGCRFSEHVGGKDVFIVQSLFDSRPEENLKECIRDIVRRVKSDNNYNIEDYIKNLPKTRDINSNLVEALIVARTARVNGARYVTAILPYLAYSRQDKPTEFKRENVAAKLIADLFFEAGIDKIITWHVHSPQIRGFYERGDKPGSNFLSPVDLFINCFENRKSDAKVKVVAIDAGGSQTVMNVAKGLRVDFGIGSKHRPKKDSAEINAFAADFTHTKHAILIDDIISTGGSYESGADVLIKQAQRLGSYIGSMDGAVSHPLLIGDAIKILKDLHEKYDFGKLYTTDTVPLTKESSDCSLIKQISIAPMLAVVVNRIHYEMPLQPIFWRSKDNL